MLLSPVTWVRLPETFIPLDYFSSLCSGDNSMKSLHLHCLLCGLVACSPDSGMMDAVFSTVCLKVRFIGLLLLCTVDGSVLQETKVLLIGL